jgi:hypothetical protein
MAIIKTPFLPEDAQFLSSNFPQYKKILGTNFPVSVLAFDAATKESAFWKFKASNYGSGNLTLVVRWAGDTATSGVSAWGAKIACITPGTDTQDLTTKAFATAATATSTHLGTTAKRVMTFTITISDLDSIAAGDTIWLELYRDAAAGGDTMTGDALFTEAGLEYSDT